MMGCRVRIIGPVVRRPTEVEPEMALLIVRTDTTTVVVSTVMRYMSRAMWSDMMGCNYVVFVSPHASRHIAVATHLVLPRQIDSPGHRPGGNMLEMIDVAGMTECNRRAAATVPFPFAGRPDSPDGDFCGSLVARRSFQLQMFGRHAATVPEQIISAMPGCVAGNTFVNVRLLDSTRRRYASPRQARAFDSRFVVQGIFLARRLVSTAGVRFAQRNGF